MPPAPKSWDPVSMAKYFGQIEGLDPKGSALAHEVSDFADNLAETALGKQGLGGDAMFDWD